MRDETVVINLVGLDFYDLTLGQPLVEDCVADEVRYSGIVIFFHPLEYDFFFLGREADVVKVFAVLAVFCFYDSKFLIVTPSLDNDTSCYLCQIKELFLSSIEVRIVGIVVKIHVWHMPQNKICFRNIMFTKHNNIENFQHNIGIMLQKHYVCRA